MKKIIILAVVMFTLVGMLVVLDKRDKSLPDDAYYAKITEISKEEKVEIKAYNPLLDKKIFVVDTSNLDEKMLDDGYIKIIVDGNDNLLEIDNIEKIDLPQKLKGL